jgi:ubiquitin-protein ligase
LSLPELPYEIWNKRVKNEIEILKKLNIVDSKSIKWYKDSVEIWLNLKALGFIQKYRSNNLNVAPKTEHRVFIKINRSFPYPGGIDFSWHSEIFHPNIHPVELHNSNYLGTGYICLNILRKWSKLSDLETTAKSLQILVENPNPEDPLQYNTCIDAAAFFKKNPVEELRKIFKVKRFYRLKEKNDNDIVVYKE